MSRFTFKASVDTQFCYQPEPAGQSYWLPQLNFRFYALDRDGLTRAHVQVCYHAHSECIDSSVHDASGAPEPLIALLRKVAPLLGASRGKTDDGAIETLSWLSDVCAEAGFPLNVAEVLVAVEHYGYALRHDNRQLRAVA